MLKRTFDPRRPHRAVIYLRVSSGRQNPRSPDQQEREIRGRLAARGYPWVVVAVYRDDAVSGKFQRRRPEYARMLADVKSGAVACDLILVDTTDRFGRHGEMSSVRRRLHRQHGVLLLTAESDFADPTSQTGKAYAAFEEMRAEGENATKAHMVFRGKKDLALQKFWPGGPRPFGYRLVAVLGERLGCEVPLGSVLEPLPEEAAVVAKAFRRALDLGEGQTKIAKALNADPEIPERLKPFFGSTVGYWLDSRLYRGELVWAANSTGIVDDVRRVEPNAEEEVVRVPEFCPAIVDDETWSAVQRVRQARRERHGPAASSRHAAEKQIAPLAAGLTLKYPLSGLVRCGACGASMRPVSGRAKGKGGAKGKRYAYYVCPRAVDGICGNSRYVSEPWLRETVTAALKASLFPVTDGTSEAGGPDGAVMTAAAVEAAPWFRELREEIVAELRRAEAGTGPSPLEAEDLELADRMEGWRQTLGKRDLGLAVRADLEKSYEEAAGRRQEIAAAAAAREAARRGVDAAADASAVAAALNRLADSLAGGNASRTNLELSLHVERVACFPGGRVVLRTCRLGGLAGAVELLDGCGEVADGDAGNVTHARPDHGLSGPFGVGPVRPRRRARLRVDGGTDTQEDELAAAADWAADPHRFAGLDARWFEEREFRVPAAVPWFEANAEAVLARVEELERRGLTASLNALAPEFGVSRPTLARALAAARSRRAAEAAHAAAG